MVTFGTIVSKSTGRTIKACPVCSNVGNMNHEDEHMQYFGTVIQCLFRAQRHIEKAWVAPGFYSRVNGGCED